MDGTSDSNPPMRSHWTCLLGGLAVQLFRPYNLLIKLATYPAPNPLSIFTTVTLLEQLFNIPSSAANP